MRNLIILALILPYLAFGRKTHWHDYRVIPKSLPSCYTIQRSDSTLDKKTLLTFSIKDDLFGDGYPFAMLKIKSTKLDTVVKGDIYGFGNIYLNPGTHCIKPIAVLSSTPIIIDSLILEADTKTNINFYLGNSHSLIINIIHSKRRLSKKEINTIIEDLTYNREPELVKNKTCYIMIEI